MGKIRVLSINGEEMTLTRCNIEKNNVKIGKETKEVQNAQIFRLGTTKGGKTLKRRACLLYNSGKSTFYSIEDAKDEELEGITNEDRKKYVKKNIADSLSEMKPMSLAMFGVLLGVGILNIILMIILLRV